MNANTVICTASGNTIDVEHHGVGVVLMLGNDLGENVRRSALSIDDIDALMDRLTVERERAATEIERRIDEAVRILAGLGMDAKASRAAIGDGFIDPAAVIARYNAAAHDEATTQPPQFA